MDIFSVGRPLMAWSGIQPMFQIHTQSKWILSLPTLCLFLHLHYMQACYFLHNQSTGTSVVIVYKYNIEVQLKILTVTSHLACVLVHEVEDCLLFGIPVDAITQSLSSYFTCDYLQQVHLDWLLDEHHVVLRHGWKQEEKV